MKYIKFESVNRSVDDALKIYKQRIEDSLEVFEKFHNDFIIRPCPICGNVERGFREKFHKTYEIEKCTKCSSRFVNPSPNLKALDYYYNECICNSMLANVYRNRPSSKNTIISNRAGYIIEIIKKKLKENSEKVKILEVGCNSGVFLSELKQGLKTENIYEYCILQGVDIDKEAVLKSVDSELELFAMPIEVFAKNKSSEFDLVIHFELIEHLVDPFQFTMSINKLLKPSGLHHFHTPNALGMGDMALGCNSTRLLAHGIFPPMHINAFTVLNITHFALRTGFKVISVDTPGSLDVDMVKLMSKEIDCNSPFSKIVEFTEDQLAVIQKWLMVLNASSHMRVNLKKA